MLIGLSIMHLTGWLSTTNVMLSVQWNNRLVLFFVSITFLRSKCAGWISLNCPKEVFHNFSIDISLVMFSLNFMILLLNIAVVLCIEGIHKVDYWWLMSDDLCLLIGLHVNLAFVFAIPCAHLFFVFVSYLYVLDASFWHASCGVCFSYNIILRYFKL